MENPLKTDLLVMKKDYDFSNGKKYPYATELKIGDLFVKLFGLKNGVNLEVLNLHKPHGPIDLSVD